MKHDEDNAVVSILVAGSLLVLLFACFSCKQQRVVTITEYKERVVHDTAYLTRWNERTDSILVHDTTYISADGVVHHNRTERQRSRTATNDTIFRIVEKHSVDSIPVVVEVEKPVRYRSGYDRFTSWAFWLIVVAALVALALWLTNKRYHWWNVVRTVLKLM